MVVDHDCPHLSLTGDEGPVSELGRWPVRWKCDSCGAIWDERTSAQRGRMFEDHKIIAPRRRLLTMWQCECGWSNTGADVKCQRCFLPRPA